MVIANFLKVNAPQLAANLVLLLAVAPAAVIAQTTNLSGSIPSGAPKPETLQISLGDAITRALKFNLGAVEQQANTRTVRGQRLVALSRLLPQINGNVFEDVAKSSLAPIGLTSKEIPGIPRVIGPYSYSEAGVSLSQPLFDFDSFQRFRAALNTEQAAQLNYRDILDLVTLSVGNAYLQIIEAKSRIGAQEAQVRNARALNDQASDAYRAGTSPRIEATRTEVQLHTEEYNLSVSRNSFAIAKLTLARAIGLPLGQEFEISDDIPYADLQPPTIDEALQVAYNSRSDLRAALATQKAAEQTLSASRAERYPTLTTSGNYTDVGPTFSRSNGTFNFQANLNIPIFAGGRIKGDIVQAEAALQQRKAETENLRGQVDYDVRTAFLNLAAAKEQVDVAKRNVALANENLARSKDRFSSGVTDSVEVVQAEQSLASANDQYITSLYNHGLAKLALARALGVAQTEYHKYLGGK